MKIYNTSLEKKGLMITPLFGQSTPFQKILYQLKDYQVFLPTLSGTESSTTFHSIEREADLIYTFFRDRQITHFDFILGFSLGANIALDLYSRGTITTRKLVLDGMIVQHHSKLVQKIMLMKFKSIRKNFLADKFSQESIETDYPDCYGDMKSLLRRIDETTARNALSSICSFQLPKIKDPQVQLSFIYGEHDPSIQAIDTLQKKYTQANFLQLEHLPHCAYAINSPESFFSFLS